MKFTKVHSLGNDFLIVEKKEIPPECDFPPVVRALCERHTGVGADGFLVIDVQDADKGVVDFCIFNADGTEPEISGNGLRCAAAYLHYKQAVKPSRLIFKTHAGERESLLQEKNDRSFRIRIEMGTPLLSSEDIPFDDGSEHEKVIDYPLSINQKIYRITALSLGNPHCAIFFDRFPSRIEWHQIGREIELHPFFPKKTNIEFIRILNRKEIEVLFWERGVGETLSSGSGSCAAAVAAILKDLTGREVTVRTSMGELMVEWKQNVVYQTGPAEIVFTGDFPLC
ncbi:MAG: diaminopimelate epimerase [Candidatus Aminicenantes bacterium]|nr:diaminopimelate epimerase [Candidatus Aminicenantes bacterium]RLE02619.1 MAG: diaminopimelate epimerase [Candidatus Aminicenantes bacterium]RLE03100.1 MAG: diaminopimelate epimerase [Candidatus Aminicenantes bacterium]HHF42909.1 diaminopimelate epimerase [Candidatus Aminicenantes bacterium]